MRDKRIQPHSKHLLLSRPIKWKVEEPEDKGPCLIRAHKNMASPPSRRVFTTDGKANHSGISSPDRRRLRNSVPESLAILSPFSFATLSEMYPRSLPCSSPT